MAFLLKFNISGSDVDLSCLGCRWKHYETDKEFSSAHPHREVLEATTRFARNPEAGGRDLHPKNLGGKAAEAQ